MMITHRYNVNLKVILYVKQYKPVFWKSYNEWMINTFRSIFIKLLKIWLHTKESSLVHFIKVSHIKIQ